eukprot:TRINITY_DN576_c0_g1_i1.p1 TRINITY_DN576_c0_g1~~TRINITY_DN576_c0_g1_i1.p1  ORF type:complete len:708 (-),score=132.94 TRINITY_DN576_c0_g1_i1:423-2546(-)
MTDQGGAPAAAGDMSTEDYAKYLQSLGYDPSYAEYYKNYYAQMYAQQQPGSSAGGAAPPPQQHHHQPDPMAGGWGGGGAPYGGQGGYGGPPMGGGHYGGGHMGGGGPGGPAQPSPNLWIGNLPPDVQEYELRDLFAPYGNIEHVRMLNQKNCAFVKYFDMESAARAHSAGPSMTLHGVPIKVGWGKSDPRGNQGPGPQGGGGGGGNEPSPNLWVGNLDYGVTEDEVRSLFQKYGPLERVKVLSQKNCAFVTFSMLDHALSAMRELQGYQLRTQPIRINFGKTDPRPSDRDRDGGRGGGRGGDYGRRDYDNRSPRGPREPLYDPPFPPTDPKVKDVIDKLAATIVQANAPAMEDMIREKQKDNPLFAFLDDAHEFNTYYRWKIYDLKNPGAPVPPKLGRPRAAAMSPGPSGRSPASGGLPPWSSASPRDSNLPPWARNQEIKLAALPPPEQPLETTWADDFDTNEHLAQFDGDILEEILRTLMPTKESIKAAKDWVMERPRQAKAVALHIRQFVERATDFSPRLNALYLVNDVLQNSQRRRPGGETDPTLDDFASAFVPHVGAMLFSTFVSQPPDRQEKVAKLLKIWKDKNIFPDDLLGRMDSIMRGQLMVPNPPVIARRAPAPPPASAAPMPPQEPWSQRPPSPPGGRGMYSAVVRSLSRSPNSQATFSASCMARYRSVFVFLTSPPILFAAPARIFAARWRIDGST